MKKKVLIFFFFIHSCTTSIEQTSSRKIGGGLPKGEVWVNSRSLSSNKPSPKLYVKKKKIRIVPKRNFLQTGSLFNPLDQRSYLIATKGPIVVGNYLDVKIQPNRKKHSEDDIESDSVASLEKNISKEDVALLKSLPHLEPMTNHQTFLLSNLKMKVVHRYANGDAKVEYSRTSETDQKLNHVSITARVPYQSLTAQTDITTRDLVDIQFNEKNESQFHQRNSSHWEDEFTVRLSGFSEVASKYAMSLEEKRKNLEVAKKSLEERITTFGAERASMAKERRKLLDQQNADKKTIESLKETIASQPQQSSSNIANNEN